MNKQTKIVKAGEEAFKPRATLKNPIHCFAIKLDALLRVRAFISNDEMRYTLQGVFVGPHKDGGAICVATDGHRLGILRDELGLVTEAHIVRLPKELKAPPKSAGSMWAVLTRTGHMFGHLSLVPELFDREHDTPESAIARVNECYQRFGDVIIDGEYVDYAKVLPTPSDDEAVRTFNADYFKSFGKTLTIRGGREDAPHLILDYADRDFVGVLMPMRYQSNEMQDWAKALLPTKVQS